MRWMILGLMAVVLAGCGGSAATRVIVVTATPSGSEASYSGSATDPYTQQHITVHRAATDTTGDRLTRPDPGKYFQIFYVTMTNLNGHAESPNTLDFKLMDAKGDSYDCGADLPQKYSPELSYDAVAPGDHAAGWVPCELPRSVTRFTLEWLPAADTDNPPLKLARYTVTL